MPLAIFGLALIGVLGLGDVWTDTLAPEVEERVRPAVFFAIDFSVQEVLASGAGGLLVFAGVLLLWDVTWAIKAVIVSLNRIREAKDRRRPVRLVGVAVGLAIGVGGCVLASVLLVTVLPRALGGWAVVPAWVGVVVLLFVAVWLLFRFAPAEGAPPDWASAGAILVVAGWVVASLAYGAWVGISSYDSPAGVLLAFLLLTTYLLVCSVILLAGFELDEQARRRTR
ncbi:MAG: YihY/virulence factor BrkB family protein [Actinomycetota bacterium]|nr:YihY/virulence factor BrkB family protein [Actinomycetota bacterium]